MTLAGLRTYSGLVFYSECLPITVIRPQWHGSEPFVNWKLPQRDCPGFSPVFPFNRNDAECRACIRTNESAKLHKNSESQTKNSDFIRLYFFVIEIE